MVFKLPFLKKNALPRFIQCVVMGGLLFFFAQDGLADPFGLSGNWVYQESGGRDVSDSTFTQGYNLNFVKEMTELISLTGSVHYNENVPGAGARSESISPSLGLMLRNDLFSFNLSGSENQSGTEGSPTSISRSWGSSFSSAVENWPGVSLQYSRSQSTDDQSPPGLDTEGTSFSAGLDYKLEPVSVVYNFAAATSEDGLTGNASDSNSHFAQGGYSDSFFNRRISISASQQYSQSRVDSHLRTGINGEFLVPVIIQSASSGTDDTPLEGSLTDNPLLIDVDRLASAGVEIARETKDQNVGMQVNFQPVSRFEVYLDQRIPLSVQNFLSWTLYQSANGQFWTQVIQPLQVSYLTENLKTVVQLDVPTAVTARHLKLVIRNGAIALTPVFITEVEAGEIRTSSDPNVSVGNQFVSHQSQFSLGYRPTASWSLTYGIRRVQNLPGSGPENSQSSQSINAAYSPGGIYSIVFGVSDSIDVTEGDDERNGRSYSLSGNLAPMKTLSLGAGYTRSESTEGGVKASVFDSVNAAVSTIIFPDLSAGLSGSWTRNQSLENGTSSNAYGVGFSTSLRLTPRADLGLQFSYAQSSAETASGSRASNPGQGGFLYGANFSYRPSDVLFLSSSYTQEVDTGDVAIFGSLSWLCTQVLQASGNFALQMGEEESQSYGSSLDWSLTPNISLQGSGNMVSSASGDAWSLLSSLSAAF